MGILKNTKHELYCRFVVEGMTSVDAHEAAGYARSDKNAGKVKGMKGVRERILELQTTTLKRHEVTVDRVVEEYAKLGFSDIRKLFNENGTMKKPGDLDDSTAAALLAIEVSSSPSGQAITRFKIADKKGALDSLGKHLHMFKEDITIKAEVVQKTVSDVEVARRLAFLMLKGDNDVPT